MSFILNYLLKRFLINTIDKYIHPIKNNNPPKGVTNQILVALTNPIDIKYNEPEKHTIPRIKITAILSLCIFLIF